MKPAVMPRDAERLVVDLATDLLADDDCTVGIEVPKGWVPTARKHLQIVSDGDPVAIWPIATRPTVRLVARAGTTTDAKDLCARAYGSLCAYRGDDVIARIQPLTGVLAARDPDTHAELASATVRVTVRTEPIESGS